MIKKTKTILLLLGVSSLLLSCASGYRAFKPETFHYMYRGDDTSILVEFQPNFLTGKYAVREKKFLATLVAVRITNNTANEIVPANFLRFSTDGKELSFMPMNTLFNATKQNPDKSLSFLSIAPINVYYKEETTYGNEVTSRKRKFYPIGIILGPALAFGNRAAAKKANAKYEDDLKNLDILQTPIKSGDHSVGFIALNGRSSPGMLNVKIIR